MTRQFIFGVSLGMVVGAGMALLAAWLLAGPYHVANGEMFNRYPMRWNERTGDAWLWRGGKWEKLEETPTSPSTH